MRHWLTTACLRPTGCSLIQLFCLLDSFLDDTVMCALECHLGQDGGCSTVGWHSKPVARQHCDGFSILSCSLGHSSSNSLSSGLLTVDEELLFQAHGAPSAGHSWAPHDHHSHDFTQPWKLGRVLVGPWATLYRCGVWPWMRVVCPWTRG